MKKDLMLILLAVAFVVGVIVIFTLVASRERKDEQTAQWRDYVLYSNTSEYEQELFFQLDDELEEEELASLIFKLFVAKFYSLDFAESNSDVRGVQFVYEPFQESFIQLARESVYERVESKIFMSRREKLPIVEEVEIYNIEESSFLVNDVEEEFKSYLFTGTLHYDLATEYKKELEVEIIINNDRFDVVWMETYLTN